MIPHTELTDPRQAAGIEQFFVFLRCPGIKSPAVFAEKLSGEEKMRIDLQPHGTVEVKVGAGGADLFEKTEVFFHQGRVYAAWPADLLHTGIGIHRGARLVVKIIEFDAAGVP